MAGAVTESLLAEWMEIQYDFIREMSKGVAPAMYEQQLRALKLKDDKGVVDPTVFINRFDEICARLYPLSSWTNYADRSRMLAAKFEDVLKDASTGTLYETTCLMMNTSQLDATEYTLQDWEAALLKAFGFEEQKKSRSNRHDTQGGQYRGRGSWRGGRGGWQGSGGNSAGSTQKPAVAQAAAMSDGNGKEGEEHTDEAGGDEQLSAADNSRGGGRGGRGRGRGRPQWTEQRQSQYDAGLCFRCNQSGHKASDKSCPLYNRPTRRSSQTSRPASREEGTEPARYDTLLTQHAIHFTKH